MDQTIAERFGELHCRATQGELYSWRESREGRLAEVIVLDQFSRNIYRDKPESFAADSLALVLAQEAIQVGADQKVSAQQRPFFYLPFMHSESLAIQNRSIELYQSMADELGGDTHNNLTFAHKHRDIIVQFGRYPHRNDILGRASTTVELEFLKQPGSSF